MGLGLAVNKKFGVRMEFEIREEFIIGKVSRARLL